MTSMNDDKKATYTEPPLIVIVGPTASGKSAVGMEIAKECGGEIICADSRTIYKGLDIGTAKPTAQDQAEVPHHGLDLVEPGDVFTAADFKAYAVQKIEEIRGRGRIPLLVGGTGLYVDGILFDYQFGAPNMELRQELENLSLEELQERCEKDNVQLPENPKNRRQLQRALEQNGVNTRRETTPLDNTIVVGITTDTDTLRERITRRADELFTSGMVEEATRLGEQYGWDSEAMTGNIYPLVKRYLDGALTQDELRQKFITADWRLAKRQRTWLRRNPWIQWKTLDEAPDFIRDELLKHYTNA